MAPRGRRWLVLVLAAAVLGQGCATHSAPIGWLPKAKDLPRWSRGAWIEIDAVRGATPRTAGELIAVGEDQVHVLTEEGLRAVPAVHVRSAKLVLYANDGGSAAMALVLTHGWFLPLTIIPWIAISSGESLAPILHRPPWPLEQFRPFARFPQGLPPGLGPAELGPLRAPPRWRS